MPTCVICGKEFTKRAPKQVTCGGECQVERQRQHVRAYNDKKKRMRTEIVLGGLSDNWAEGVRQPTTSGQWFPCTNESCKRTNMIPSDAESVRCWRCYRLVTRTEIISKKRYGYSRRLVP